MRYAITVRGRRHLFKMLDDAIAAADVIFDKTGVVVGIERLTA